MIDITQHVIAAVADQTGADPADIVPAMKLRDLDLDELDIISVLNKAEKQFGFETKWADNNEEEPTTVQEIIEEFERVASTPQGAPVWM